MPSCPQGVCWPLATPASSPSARRSQLERAYPGLCGLSCARLLRREPQLRERGPAVSQGCALAAGERAAQVQQVHQQRAVAEFCDGRQRAPDLQRPLVSYHKCARVRR